MARFLIIDLPTNGRTYSSIGTEAMFGRHPDGSWLTGSEWIAAMPQPGNWLVLGPISDVDAPEGWIWSPTLSRFVAPPPPPVLVDRLDDVLATLASGGMNTANRNRVRDAIVLAFPDQGDRLRQP